MPMIRIGEISYLNVYPIYYFLKKYIESAPELNFLDIVHGTPAFLNGELKSGRVDISPSSSFYYIANYENSLIYPDLSISSREKVNSIYLFSDKPIEQFSRGETIYYTPETLTSINMLKVMLAEFYGLDLHPANFVPLEANDRLELSSQFSGSVPAGKNVLYIGNAALKLIKVIPAATHVYDLADLWYKFTGYPFVFALFIIRKEAFNSNPFEFKLLYKYLSAAKIDAVSGFGEAADSVKKKAGYEFITYDELIEYWTECLSFDFGENERKGFETYCELLYKYGIIPSVPSLNFPQGL